jgi:hypothetical protein
MKINLTTTHDLTFAVEAFWSEEGGMGEDQLGKPVSTIEEAIALLMQARAAGAKAPSGHETPWIITIDVHTKHSKS